MAEELVLYTVHADREVREVSSKVLTACLRCHPPLRETLLLGVARVLGRIADEHEAVCVGLKWVCGGFVVGLQWVCGGFVGGLCGSSTVLYLCIILVVYTHTM